MKRNCKRLLALCLCALMLCSDVAGLMPRAQAASAAPVTATVSNTGARDNFQDPNNGRPNLFVDFLGDNNNYVYEQGGANSGLTKLQTASLGAIATPAPYDQSSATNPTGPGNDWPHYTQADVVSGTVFWVGLGVDRVELLKLLEDGDGLTSLEAGFYYDSTVIEPYIDPTLLESGASLSTATDEQLQAAYQKTIQKANIQNTGYPENTQWSDDYFVCQALTGLTVESDPVTREELNTPTMDDIENNTLTNADRAATDWKMTYISLELKDIADTDAVRRLADVTYLGVDGLDTGTTEAGEEVPITPASASGDQYVEDGVASSGYDYNYLLLIPFRLKKYGSLDFTSLRLVRDATHFSIGGGTWGVDAYGAWERTTTRNGAVAAVSGGTSTLDVTGRKERDLKLLTRFAGDLMLFTAGRASEKEYNALLRIIGGGGSLNRAKLTVDGDPAVWPVWAEADGETIGGLQSGQGMYLDVHTQKNYVATVTVTYVQSNGSGGGETIYHAYTQVVDGDNDDAYRFVMPRFIPYGSPTVTVTVTFQYKEGENALVYLSEDPQPDEADRYAVGNQTTIRTSLDASYNNTGSTETINSFSPTSEHPNYGHPGIDHPARTPVANAKKDQNIEIKVATHHDYMAVVRIFDFDQGFVVRGLDIDATGVSGVTPDDDLTISNPDYVAGGSEPQFIDNPDYGKIVLPQGGTIRLRMSTQDLDVEVTYEKGETYQATLEVYNTNPDAVDFDLNTAQLVYDRYDGLDLPSRGYSSVVYNDYEKDVVDDHRAIQGNRQLPWVSASQATLSGSLGGDTGQTGKTWHPGSLTPALDTVTGGQTIMALLASSSSKSNFRGSLSGLDLANVAVDDGGTGYVGLRKNAAQDAYGDPDVADTSSDPDRPAVTDALWELRQAIDGDTASGGLREQYRKTVNNPDSTVAYTYYDLTAAQVQVYLLEISALPAIKAENDLAYQVAYRRYLTVRADYERLKSDPIYSGMAALQAPAVNQTTTVTSGKREYQALDYKNTYLVNYDAYLDEYEAYIQRLEANAGTLGVTAPTSYPASLPAKQTIALRSDTDAVSFLSGYTWTPADVPTQEPTTGPVWHPGQADESRGGTIETRSGRTVYIVLEADSAYELDLDNTNVYPRGDEASGYATGANALTAPVGVTPTPVDKYENVYSFVMPSQDCVVRVAYRLRGTRKLNIRYVGAAKLDDNEAIVEAYAVADPAAVTPDLVTITNKGYSKTPLPSYSVENNGTVTYKTPTTATYTAATDTYVADPVEKALQGSVVTVRAKAAKGYEVKSVEAKNSDSIAITVTQQTAANPADGDVYTFTIADGRVDDVTLTITYGPEKEEEYTATIRSRNEGSAHSGNRANWYVVNGTTVTRPTVISAVKPDTALVGHVSVAPGYYIKSITAWGASGSYAFTYTGDGYNNGYGTTLTGTDVPVVIDVNMPHEDLIVDVVFAEGPPEPAPGTTLTLLVKDDDNTETDPNKAAANYASAKVYAARPDGWPATTVTAGQTLPASGELGKNVSHGNGVLSDCQHVEAGQWVVVDFTAQTVNKTGTSEKDPEQSYYVSSVTVGPDNVGAALVWEDADTVSFYMPAGSTAVTVEFSKYPANGRLPDYVLTVRETYTDLTGSTTGPTTTDSVSYVKNAKSETIERWSTGGRNLESAINPETVPPTDIANATGAAIAGETVTMSVAVAPGDGTAANPGWYIQSVVLVSNGAVTRLTVPNTPDSVDENGADVYKITFRMPANPAEFIVHYRKGPKPDVADYAFTLTIDDPDNALNSATGVYDDNHITATFTDPTNTAVGHDPLYVGKVAPTAATPSYVYAADTAVQYIHSGDVITLETTLDGEYYLEYMIVNPAGLRISPVWSSPTTASFVMPKEGVAVVARVVKGTAQRYTANLILRYEDENGNQILPTGKTIHDIGKGTFASPTAGTLDNYPNGAVYSTVQLPGTGIDYDLYAYDGYYIDRITIEPVILGVTGSLSGSCGYQDGGFVMPYASVNVNVWFKAGWPDEIPYDLTIKVHDSSLDPDDTLDPATHNNVALRAVTGRTPVPDVSADKVPVYGGQSRVVDAQEYIRDRDVVTLDIRAMSGYYVDSSSISVTDSRGDPVTWWYVPGGIAYTQPPRAVTAEVTFRKGDPAASYQATLHLAGDLAGADEAKLSTDGANTHAKVGGVAAAPATVSTDNAAITELYQGDVLYLSAMPGTDRHISAAYAVTTGGTILPIYGCDAAGTTVSADLAQYVPGKPGTQTYGALAMPESDVDIYVKFADGPVSIGEPAVNLVVSGPGGSGEATAAIDEVAPKLDQTMTVTAPGMDSRYTTQGNEVVVTFDPAAGYGITSLEVTSNATGAAAPYSWISVLQDPPSLTGNTNLWSGTAPAPDITHPNWKANPKKQIKLTVPAGGVTVKVTYGAVSDKDYQVQVVVNDPLAGTASASSSRNNAWVSQQSGTDTGDATLKKLQVAKPGEWVDLDITVHPGYRIEFVKVIPQSFGIVPGLPVGTDMGGGVTYYLHDQNTGFVMPEGNCTVYVKFVQDTTATKTATLVVKGAPIRDENNATIHSPITGTKGPVAVQGTPQSVSARPGVDWVTSDYYWDTGTSSIASITVTRSGSGGAVPFTQVDDPATGHGQITFPMVSDDVVVTITYRADPDPVGQEVVLHVIDKDRLTAPTASAILGDPNSDSVMDNYGKLEYNAPSGSPSGYVSTATAEIAPGVPENTATIYVPAGQTVDVTACSDAANLDGNGKVYIEAAYVLFTQNSQMVNFNLTPDNPGPGFSGLHQESSFTVHPGRNDVYVVLTREAPAENEYAAVLMLKSPSADTQSEAGIHADEAHDAWSNADPALRDKVRANDPADSHAYVTAREGNRITVSVEPASGYVIDYIQITPLGFPLDTDPVYCYTRTGNTLTFEMPHCNVAITVYLKRGSNAEHTATLRFIQDPNCVAHGNAPQAEDYAKLTWTPTGQPDTSIYADAKADKLDWASEEYPDVSRMMVTEGSTVTLDVTLDSDAATGESDVILSAFAVRKDTGSIVVLTPVYPTDRTTLTGIEGVTESVSGAPGHDNTLSDATATFTMPMGDVEVYVVVTTEPPADAWHTVALIATDHGPTGSNIGPNVGYLWNNTTPDDRRVAYSDHRLASGTPSRAIIAWATVTESETFSVLPEAGTGYRFDPPAVMTGNNSVTSNLTTLYSNYLYEVSNITCNQVVRIDFESSDALELTVEIDDPDNPSDGKVKQEVTVDPAGTTPPTLRLTSDSVAGSYQIVSGVTPGDTVELTATPYAGYDFYVQLHALDGSVTNIDMTDSDGDNTWNGSFTMPSNNARVVFTFYKRYRATLELVNHVTDDTTGQAAMREDKRGLTDLNVSSLRTSASFDSLPNGTTLDAWVEKESREGRRVTGLLTVNGSTTFLTPQTRDADGDPGHYFHTIDHADATITLVLDEETETDPTYYAAVKTVNKPAGTADPTIRDNTHFTDPGVIWTAAKEADDIQVHVTVPAGYQVTLSARRTDDSAAVTLSAATLTADGDVTFSMPGANAEVTVTYRRTQFDLTLHIVQPAGLPASATSLTAGSVTLAADGASASVSASTAVDLSATPASGVEIKYIFYQYGGTTRFVTVGSPTSGYTAAPLLSMPDADVDVTVVYAAQTATPPKEEDEYFIATVVKVDATNDPGNQILNVRNESRSTLPDGSPLPGVDPHWVAGCAQDAVRVSFQAAAGYVVEVTAETESGTPLYAVQIGTGGTGTGSVAFPKPGENIIITVTYKVGTPSEAAQEAVLQLVEHDIQGGNAAKTTDFTDNALSGLSLKGSDAPSKAPVERSGSSTAIGNDLRTLANWADGYRVIRVTVAVRDTATNQDLTPEMDLQVSTYGGNATARCPVPSLSAGQVPVLRVYYGNVYTATFHLVGADPTDTHEATDVVTGTSGTVSYTAAYDVSDTAISKPIQDNLDRIENYQGDGTEDVQTTAKAGTGRRLVGVVWESDSTGARPTTSTVADRYDFTMPADDVDFYAVYEAEPDDPKDRTYIAKVAFASDEHLGDSQNQVTIRNADNSSAVSGKYWVAAKGGDSVELTVKVAQGYQAEIVTAKVDDSAKVPAGRAWADDFHYYVTRKRFVPNLASGKTSTFTMPLETDATVTIRYTKGYDLTLAVTDASGKATSASPHQVMLTYDTAAAAADQKLLKWTNDGTAAVYDPATATLLDVEGGRAVGTDITKAADATATVTRYTPFTGTVTLTQGSASPFYPFIMPYEDTVENVLLRDENATDDLLAKVELAGDSDINGNELNSTDPIVDKTDRSGLQPNGSTTTPASNITTTGTIWTTTDGGHVIDVTFHVAKGYVAKIKVRRDNDNYYNNPNDPSKWDYLDADEYQFQQLWNKAGATAGTTQEETKSWAGSAGITEVQIGYNAAALPQTDFSDNVSGEQRFRFVMPADRAESSPGAGDGDAEVDVTVLITFEKLSDMPRPFDPRNVDEGSDFDKIDHRPGFLEDGFIYGENRGDYAIIEIPTLAKDEGDVRALFDTDNYDAPSATPVAVHDNGKDATKKVTRYVFALYDAGTDTYTELVEGTDVTLLPYDEDDPLVQSGDIYNYILGLWNGTETWHDTTAGAAERDFVGSKFLLLPKAKADGSYTTNGAILEKMLNNQGSLESYTDGAGATQYRTRLYVRAEDEAKNQSDYTEVWVRPWFALGVRVLSYGPTHELTGELYRLMEQDELDTATGYLLDDTPTYNTDPSQGATSSTAVDAGNFQHYKWDEDDAPEFTAVEVIEEGSGKWLQLLRIRSSELLGGFDRQYDPHEDAAATPAKSLLDNVDSNENLTYALVLKKAANLTYTRINIDLNPAHYTGGTALTDYCEQDNSAPDRATRTFMLQDTVQLIAGDVDENGKTKLQDYDAVYDYVYRSKRWSDLAAEPAAPLKTDGTPDTSDAAYVADMESWAISIYNPKSLAYRCDLDGDRNLTVVDLSIVNSRFNYNRDETDYHWYYQEGSDYKDILPFGLGPRDENAYTALFALNAASEGEVFPDTYWDETVDPAETLAIPMETFYVDSQGGYALRVDAPEAPAGKTETPEREESHDERVETPLGEEALDRAAAPQVSQDGQAAQTEPDIPPPQPDEAEDQAAAP